MTAIDEHSKVTGKKKANLISQKYEIKISNILFVSVAFSGLLMIIGLLLSFIQNIYPENLDSSLIFSEMVHLTPIGLIYLGIIILLLSPMVRVIMSIRLYISNKDGEMVLITTLVLILMIIGIFLGGF